MRAIASRASPARRPTRRPRDREAQEHDRAGETLQPGDYPASPIEHRDGDNTPTAPEAQADWDTVVQPEREPGAAHEPFPEGQYSPRRIASQGVAPWASTNRAIRATSPASSSARRAKPPRTGPPRRRETRKGRDDDAKARERAIEVDEDELDAAERDGPAGVGASAALVLLQRRMTSSAISSGVLHSQVISADPRPSRGFPGSATLQV